MLLLSYQRFREYERKISGDSVPLLNR